MALRSSGSTRIIVGTVMQKVMTVRVATSTRSSLQPTVGVDLVDMKALLRRLERRTEQSMARATPLAQVEILIPVSEQQDTRAARAATEVTTNPRGMRKGVAESEGERNDDASDMESSDDEQATSCQSLRLQTKVFPYQVRRRLAECVYEYVCSSCRPNR